MVATGDRCADLSVRLHYAGVTHLVEPDPLTALHTAATMGDDVTPDDVTTVDVIGNYTAFGELLGARP